MEFGYIVSPRSIRNGFWLATKSEVSISDWLKIIVDQSETVKAQNDLQWFFDKLDRYFNLFFLCDSFCFFDNRKMQIAKRRKRNPLDTIYYSNNLWNFTHFKRTRNRFYFFQGQKSFNSHAICWRKKIQKFLWHQNLYFHVTVKLSQGKRVEGRLKQGSTDRNLC